MVPAGRRAAADHCLRLVLPRLDAAMQLAKRLRIVRMDKAPFQHLVRIVGDGKIFHVVMSHGDFPRPPRLRVVGPGLQPGMGQRRLHHHLALVQSAMRFHKGIIVVESAVVNLAVSVLFGEPHTEIHPAVLCFAVEQTENALEIPLLHDVFLDFRQNRRQVVGMHELQKLLPLRHALFLVHAKHVVIALVQVTAFQHAVLKDVNAEPCGNIVNKRGQTFFFLLRLAEKHRAPLVVHIKSRQRRQKRRQNRQDECNDGGLPSSRKKGK